MLTCSWDLNMRKSWRIAISEEMRCRINHIDIVTRILGTTWSTCEHGAYIRCFFAVSTHLFSPLYTSTTRPHSKFPAQDIYNIKTTAEIYHRASHALTSPLSLCLLCTRIYIIQNSHFFIEIYDDYIALRQTHSNTNQTTHTQYKQIGKTNAHKSSARIAYTNRWLTAYKRSDEKKFYSKTRTTKLCALLCVQHWRESPSSATLTLIYNARAMLLWNVRDFFRYLIFNRYVRCVWAKWRWKTVKL